MTAQGRKLYKKNWQQYSKIWVRKQTCSKLSAVVAPVQLPTERMKQKVCRLLSKIGSGRACKVLANEVYTVELKRKMSLTKAKERATSTCRCRRVSMSVQRYSVQYKGYNLMGVTTVFSGPDTPEIYFLTRCEKVQHYNLSLGFTEMLSERTRIKIEKTTSVLREGLGEHVCYFQNRIESIKYFS